MSFLSGFVGRWDGACGFRLMPHETLAQGPSRAELSSEAAGSGWLLRYSWTHPDDGEQSGSLLLGSVNDEGEIAAGWIDSWHQHPDLRLLTGWGADDAVMVEMEYSGWGWQIELRADGPELRMVMRNVIPAGLDGHEPGAYVVMDARWAPSSD